MKTLIKLMKSFRSLLVVFLLSITYHLSFAQTADIDRGCIPLTVQFTAPAGAGSFFWDFKDGANSNLENPSHIFATAGTFNVEFSNTPNGPIVGTILITVFEKPDPTITGDPMTGCAPLIVSFEDNTTLPSGVQITDYNWTFGDGSPSGNGSTINHIYNTAGNFTVSLAIETNIQSCNVTKIFDDFITTANPPPTNFNASPSSSCSAPLTVSFNNTTAGADNYTYEWDFGNGNTSTDPNPASQTYTEEGVYFVILTATDNIGCSRVFSRRITVGSPVANFDIPDTICIGSTRTIQNLSSTGIYSWSFGNGAIPSTSNLLNPMVTFPQEGDVDISLTVTSPDGACSGDTTITVYVQDPDASFTVDPTYACVKSYEATFTPTVQNYASYTWIFQDDSIRTEVSPTYTIANRDTTVHSINGLLRDTTTLIVSTSAGCSAEFSFIDTIHQPNALFLPNVVEGCAPLEVTFTDQSTSNEDIVSWQYTYGDGNSNTFTNSDDHSYTYDDPGEYPVELIISNSAGCMDTSYIQVISVGGAITPDFTADQTDVCPGDTVRFNITTPLDNIDAFHFETDDSRSFHCFQEPNLDWAYVSETGMMDVTLYVEYNGCLSQVTKEDFINVRGPIAKLDYEVICATPFDIEFRDSSFDATNIKWEFGDGDSSFVSMLTHTYDTTGDYTVKLTAENPASGCPASVDSVTVHVRDIEAGITLDTLLCLGTEYQLDASTSVDVEASCWRGYTWFFEQSNRPITTQDSSISFNFGVPGDEVVTLVAMDINGCLDTTTLDVRVFDGRPSFEVDKDTICFPSDVTFTDQSTADTTIVSWSWNFGDGNMDMGQVIGPHTYQNATTNPILPSLEITDAVGCPWSFSLPIEVYQPTSIISTIPFDPVICEGEDIRFAASDFTAQGSNLSFDWNFGNGETSTNQIDTITYPTGGTYTVNLNYEEIATGCSGSTSIPIEVQSFPTASFSSNVDGQEIICFPSNIQLMATSTGTSPLTHSWDFGNGQMGAGPTVSTSYGKGTFEVELISSTSAGCTDTTSRSFTLVGPEGDFDLDPGTICKGESITFNIRDTVDISSFTWDFGDGTTADNVDPVTHQFDFHPPGGQTLVQLILRGQNDACSTPVGKPINIRQVIADFDGTNGSTGCVGPFSFENLSSNADVFNWDFGDGSSSNEESPTHDYTTAGVYTISLAIENSTFGCLDTIERQIEIFEQMPLSVSSDFSICPNLTADGLAVLNPDPNTTYTWSPANLFINNNGPNPATLPLTTTTTFTVTAIDANGCDNSLDVTVTVEAIEIPLQVSATSPICSGSNSLMELENPDINSTYTWSPANLLVNSTGANVQTIPLTTTTTFTLTVEDREGCIDSEDITITVVPPISDPGDQRLCALENEEKVLVIPTEAVGLYDFSWFPVTGGIDINNPDQDQIVTTPTNQDSITYTLTLTSDVGCPDVNINYIVSILQDIKMPNAFTPDGDGVNDDFGPVLIGGAEGFVDSYTLIIYNRWGEKIFETNNPAERWDGTKDGKLALSDVYIYIVEASFATDSGECSFQSQNGDVTLIR